jgi:uncharacterized coiled-coil protein SlyX
VAHLFDNAHDETGEQQRHAPQRPRWVWAAGIAGLAILGIASAVLWRAWDDTLSFPSFASLAAPGPGPAAAPAAAPDTPVGSKEFRAFQQQIAGSLQSTAQLVAAQQAEIKRLSDQVSALTAKIDALQNPGSSAQAAVPVPPPAAPAAAARKKPAAAKPAPGISVGGAPLPPPSGR